MIVMLNAESWSCGLWNYQEDIEIDFSKTTLTKETMKSIEVWKNDYEKYSANQGTLDKVILKRVSDLDNEGIALLKEIALEWNDPKIEKYYYYSVAEDKLKYVIYKDGTEKSL